MKVKRLNLKDQFQERDPEADKDQATEKAATKRKYNLLSTELTAGTSPAANKMRPMLLLDELYALMIPSPSLIKLRKWKSV